MTTILTVVGSGTLLPDPERASASFHLRTGGHALLLDAGPGAMHRLARLGLDWRAIDTIAISHFHNDHVSDLPALLHAFRFDGGERPLTLVGPVGLVDFMGRLAALHGPWVLDPSRPLTVVELGDDEPWSPEDGEIHVEAVSTPHTRESLAYRVTTADSRVGYTGDTGPSERLPTFFAGCAIVISECAVADPPEIDTHLSPASLAELASKAGPEVLVVSHVYPPRRPERVVAEICERYAGRVEAARDGLTIRVTDGRVTVDDSPPGPGAVDRTRAHP